MKEGGRERRGREEGEEKRDGGKEAREGGREDRGRREGGWEIRRRRGEEEEQHSSEKLIRSIEGSFI